MIYENNKLIDLCITEHLLVVGMLRSLANELNRSVEAGVKCLRAGGRLLFCGNGGSAADAQHLAAELTGRFLKEREPWDALALHAIEAARDKQMVVMGLTGQDGGEMVSLCDICLCVPSESTPRIQEAHILLGHIFCQLIEEALCSNRQ